MQNYKKYSNFAVILKAKMINSIKFIRKYRFTIVISIFIWTLCLIPIPDTPLDNVRLIDKWTHLVFFGSLTISTLLETLYKRKQASSGKLLACVIAYPLLTGGLIEIVQATCTGGRRLGDILDFAADAIGVAIGLVIGMLLVRCLSTCNKG